jgi:hypothetical protein
MLSMGQVSAVGTAATHLCNVPAGPCLVTITNDSSSTGSAYLGITPPASAGTLASLSSGNGMPIPSGAIATFANYKGSPGASLSVITSGTLTASVGYLVSSASGGTGL